MSPVDSVSVAYSARPVHHAGVAVRDHALRIRLAHPDADVAARLAFPRGSGWMRVAVGILDSAQIIALGVLWAVAFSPAGPFVIAGLPFAASVLALAFRRSFRSLSDARPITVSASGLRAALAVLCACALLFAVVACLDGVLAAGILAPWFVVWSASSAGASYLVRTCPGLSAVTQRAIRPTVAVVGDPVAVEAMECLLASYGTHSVVASFDPADSAEIGALVGLAATGRIDRVVVVGCALSVVDDVCAVLIDAPILVCVGLVVPSAVAGGFGGVRSPPFVSLLPNPLGDWRWVVKRALDLIVSFGLLAFTLPVLILVAVAIRVESPGPALFRQWRFGLGSRPTRILKFRTMRHDLCDQTGAERTRSRDPRVTRLGRFLRRTSIDELPQLLNVLVGDMSLVGPRPHAMHMKVGGGYYFEVVRHYRLRHRVRPGITGWAQVTGSRGEVDTIEKAIERVEKDIWYVRNWSLWLDLRILLRTAMGGFLSRQAD